MYFFHGLDSKPLHKSAEDSNNGAIVYYSVSSSQKETGLIQEGVLHQTGTVYFLFTVKMVG